MRRIALFGGIALALAGCTYDYLQHSDRVGYSAGDAVEANLAQETANPFKRSMYSTAGLGRNGSVSASAEASASAAPQ
ncbi:MAG TPA: hypothetical protein VHA07_13080 [Devosia sp.]|nr:hypothetical protein [Devosia sp.]